MGKFFYKIFGNIVDSFRGKNIWWHVVAIVSTGIIVSSGLDWFYFVHTRSISLSPLLFPAVIIGSILPIVMPFILLAWGKWKRNTKITITGFAIGQAAFLGWLISSFYKALTGRLPPELFNGQILTDTSRIFHFGFLQEGIFWGWPSSHTTVAFAVAFALITLYPKRWSIKVLAIFYAFYIGIGVSVSIHWFSEFIAGALIGTAIGITVAKSFLSMKKAR